MYHRRFDRSNAFELRRQEVTGMFRGIVSRGSCLVCDAGRSRESKNTKWDGHGHGLTPESSQMLPFTFCMGSTSLSLATPISALLISGSMRQSGELKCVI
jgi:hypothetical protein